MGITVDFKQSNLDLAPPTTEDGTPDDRVSTVRGFSNGIAVVTAWQFTPEEIEEINRTGVVFLSLLCGDHVPPMYVGSESAVRSLVQDFGGGF